MGELRRRLLRTLTQTIGVPGEREIRTTLVALGILALLIAIPFAPFILVQEWSEQLVALDLRKGRLERVRGLPPPETIECTSLGWTSCCCVVQLPDERAYEVHVWPFSGKRDVRFYGYR